MITAAGVSAFDGNQKAIASGFFLQFRNALEDHYGGPEKMDTGWISHHCFEPKVAHDILSKFVQEAGVEVLRETKLVEVLREGNRINGAVVENAQGKIEINSRITVEATEYGDVLETAKIPYRLGRESKQESGEDHAPEVADLEVQDMTLCAILKKFPDKAPAVDKPDNYDPKEFDCAVGDYCSTKDEELLNHPIHDFQSFITYASLPNDKYLLNWPFHSNDSPDSVGVFNGPEAREKCIHDARQRTLRFVYFMQNELGHPEWGISPDEFPTEDGLAMIPYIRESRRVVGETYLRMNDVLPPGQVRGEEPTGKVHEKSKFPRAKFQEDSIAIGDYFLDHHHSQEHRSPDQRLNENYPPNAPFQVPYGCLLPKGIDGLIVAEKSISVSHIVNGCTRLQPVVMCIGQAAGLAAGLCVERNLEPRELDPAELQDDLIENGVAVYPYSDLYNSHPSFKAVQRLAMTGLFPEDDPIEFQPDAPIHTEGAKLIEETFEFEPGEVYKPGMTKGEFFLALYEEICGYVELPSEEE